MLKLQHNSIIFIIAFFIGAACLTSCSTKKILTDSSRARGKEFKGSLKERYASLLDVPQREIKNEKLYKFIDDWMGAPNVAGGMKKNGVDCSGFTILLQKEIFEKNLPRTARQMAEVVKRKYEDQLEEGDLVFFNFNGQPFNHVGIYLKNNRFVHVSTSKGVIVSNLKDSWYYKHFSRCGSVREDMALTNF